MKKDMLKILLAIIVIVGSVYSFVSSFVKQPELFSELQLENIEVLAQEEVSQTCTRAVRTQNCYRFVNGSRVFVCVSVLEVASYTSTSLVIPCEHARVMPCPPGTSAY